MLFKENIPQYILQKNTHLTIHHLEQTNKLVFFSFVDQDVFFKTF